MALLRRDVRRDIAATSSSVSSVFAVTRRDGPSRWEVACPGLGVVVNETDRLVSRLARLTPVSMKAAPDPTRRNESARKAILAAAIDLVGEVGYTRLSIEGIANAAGVGKQTIYRWWSSKGSLLFDAFLAFAGEGETAALPDTGDLAADLKLVLRATVDELDDPRYDRAMRAMHVEIVNDHLLAAEYLVRLDTPMRELKKERLRSAQRAGQLSDDVDLGVAIDMLFGPVLNRWLQRTGPLTHDYVDQVVDTALRGLQPRD